MRRMKMTGMLVALVCATPCFADSGPAESADRVDPAPFSAPPSMAPTSSEPYWIARMDRADRLYRAGRTMGIVGAGVTVAGIAALVVGLQARTPGVAMTGGVLALGGGIAATYGGPVMLVAATQATTTAEQVTGLQIGRTHIVAGWGSFILLGGLPSYVFAHLQWKEAVSALDYAGLLSRRSKVSVRLVPQPYGLGFAGTF